MRELLKFNPVKMLYSFVCTLLLILVACNKNTDEPSTNDVATYRDAKNFAYDYDKYGTMVYNHASYFNGTFEPTNYLPTEAAAKFKTEFPEFLRNEQSKYPTVEHLLAAYENEGIYTPQSKELVLSHLNEIATYLENTNGLSIEDINSFILNKESEIVNRTDLNDGEKMDILPMSSIIRNFLRLKNDEYQSSKVAGVAESRGDCPWYKLSACLYKLGYTFITAKKYALIGAKIGASIGFVGGPPGVAAGAIIGGALGATVAVLVNWADLKACKEACLDPDPVNTGGASDPCKGATDLAIKINGCGLTQEFVATGQGSNVNVFQGPVSGATISNVISAVPFFSLTQSSPNTPITISLLSGCSGLALKSMGVKTFDIQSIIGSTGSIDILGARNGCLQAGDCYSLGGGFLNNPNNTVTWNIPNGNYTWTQQGNSVCFDWNGVGTYTFSATVSNACSGQTRTEEITVNVKKGICE